MPRHAGFTLLEIMLVMLLLSGVTLMVTSTLPQASSRPEAEKLLVMMRWASSQAQLDGGVIALQLSRQQAHLTRLVPDGSHNAGPFPGHRWQPVTHRMKSYRLPQQLSWQLEVSGQAQALPATLLFLPDGDQPAFRLHLIGDDIVPSTIRGNVDEIVLLESP